jgi:pyruvate dehydrogenase E2 component (dihydrolipoyllysine-residue acetyltransferase)
MATPILMPKFGQMTEECVIVEWRKQEGQDVAKGDILFTVETDKAVMDVESFEEGTLLKVLVPPGASVPVQSTVGFLGRPGEAVPAAPLASLEIRAETAEPIRKTEPALPAAACQGPGTNPQPASIPAPAPPARFRISPRAQALARECAIDPSGVAGSGPGGRVVEKDVAAYLEQQGYHQLRISPEAKQLAAQERIDILKVQASGDAGWITLADIERAAAEKPRPLSRMRQVMARRLTQSVNTAPHFFVTVEVDMTELARWRARLKERGASFTVMDFVSQAVVLSLQEFPGVNSSTDGRSVRWSSHVHLGLAVSLAEGLVVPVIRAAEELSLAELSRRARNLAEKARAGTLAPDEMAGSTFTISNMGMFDVENFTAIINPGEAAILAVASIRDQPAVRQGQVVVRSLMKITLSSDHRLIDGAGAARFVNAVKEKLEDLELWKRLTETNANL